MGDGSVIKEPVTLQAEDLVQAPASMSRSRMNAPVTSVLKKEKAGFLGLAGQSV